MKKVAVVLPTLNEVESIESLIKEVISQEKKIPGWDIEVVVSDSGSTDGTFEVVKKIVTKNPKAHLINVGFGLGVGLIEGHKYALEKIKPDVLAQIDADGQVEIDILPRLIKTIEEGYDLAIGSRFVKGGANKLSPSRKVFSYGSSLVSRIIMGPFNIKEFANSARAFTPELFKKIKLNRLPWKEKTYIIQPAFINEAILAGARYKEIPLVFKNRAEGYSKNKVMNYTYDVITYALDARLSKWGIDFPLFKLARRVKTLVKFSIVGLTGTLVDLFFYKLFINQFVMTPATSKAFSTEFGIINNFILNHLWTFRNRKTKTKVWQKFLIYNLVSFGGLAIAVIVVKILYSLYGDGNLQIGPSRVAYNTIYFFASIPPVMIWNFTINHFVTWKHTEDAN